MTRGLASSMVAEDVRLGGLSDHSLKWEYRQKPMMAMVHPSVSRTVNTFCSPAGHKPVNSTTTTADSC